MRIIFHYIHMEDTLLNLSLRIKNQMCMAQTGMLVKLKMEKEKG